MTPYLNNPVNTMIYCPTTPTDFPTLYHAARPVNDMNVLMLTDSYIPIAAKIAANQLDGMAISGLQLSNTPTPSPAPEHATRHRKKNIEK